MVIADLDIYEYMYSLYRIEEEYNSAMLDITTQSILYEDYIYEGAASSTIQDFFKLIGDAIEKLTVKFKSFIKDKVSKDAEYFNKYKDVIDKVNPIDADISGWYEYEIDKLKAAELKSWDESKMNTIAEELESTATEDDKTKSKTYGKTSKEVREMIIKEYFTDYIPSKATSSDSKDQTFDAKIQEVFRGGEAKTVNASELNIHELYEYCIEYKNLLDTIEKDHGKIDAAGDSALDFIRDFVNKRKIKAFGNSVSKYGTIRRMDTKTEQFSYANTLDYYFNEADSPAGSNASSSNSPAGSGDGGNSNNNQSSNNNSQNNNPPSGDKNNANNDNLHINDNGSNNTDDAEEKEAEAFAKRLEKFISACYRQWASLGATFIGMRTNVAKEIYTNYKRVIDWHIANYLKENNLTRDNPRTKEEEEAG